MPGLDVSQAASARATLQAIAIVSVVGLVLLAPSLAWLFILFQRQHEPAERSEIGRSEIGRSEIGRSD